MLESNLFKQTLDLTDHWFNGQTMIYPIDFLIKKVDKYAYAHHIERLMYLSNFALILGIKPLEIYKWFMICFIDSYEWVMIPNVMGMGQYSSDIKMMTKPYFSSSNYIKLMSNFELKTHQIQLKISNKKIHYYWNEIFDALYYAFINKNANILKSIYSVSRNVAHWNKKSPTEKTKLLNIAKSYVSLLYNNHK
jgi:deoxyribodipyrimidine photolyase-related protein